jgi:hypothetical protein
MTSRLALAAALAVSLPCRAAAAEPAKPAGAEAPAGNPGTIEGGLAYSQVFRFDYDRDGVRNRVQFYVYMEGSTAALEPDPAGLAPAQGSVRYIVYDLDKKKKVDRWLVGLNMGGFPEPGTPYPMTNLVIRGNTAEFDAFNMHWTVIDGGKGWQKDTVVVDDHFQKPRKGRFYGGDVVVTAPR